MSEVTVASEQQSDGIREVNAAVDQMNQITQQAAANAEESASAAGELSSQAQQMQDLVRGFRLETSDGTRRSPSSRPSRVEHQPEAPMARAFEARHEQARPNGKTRHGADARDFTLPNDADGPSWAEF